MTYGLFVTGTGTDVGKTFVTALLAKKLRNDGENAGYYKAALSGADRVGDKLVPGDAKYVCDVAGLTEDPSTFVSYIYEEAVSPHLAANKEGSPLELSSVETHFHELTKKFDYLIAEGSGGIVCPLRIDKDKTIMLVDVIRALRLPIVIVCDSALGSINRTVLTVSYAKAQGLTVKGLILNGYDESNEMHRDNRVQMEALTGVPVVGVVRKDATELDIPIKCLLPLFEEMEKQ